MAQKLQDANFIHNKENEVLNATLVTWKTSDKNIRSYIVKDQKILVFWHAEAHEL